VSEILKGKELLPDSSITGTSNQAALNRFPEEEAFHQLSVETQLAGKP
jgi:hypothetical protein